MPVSETISRAEGAQVKEHYMLLLMVLMVGHALKHVFNAAFLIVLPELKVGLGLTNTGVGTLSTVRTLGGGITVFPAGFLADRFSRRYVTILAITITLMGISHFALGRVESYAQALVVVIFTMAAMITWHPSAIGVLSRVFSSRCTAAGVA